MRKLLTACALAGLLLGAPALQADEEDDVLLGTALAAALGFSISGDDDRWDGRDRWDNRDRRDNRWDRRRQQPHPYYNDGYGQPYYNNSPDQYYRGHHPRGKAHGYWRKNNRAHPYAYSRRYFDYGPHHRGQHERRRDGRWEWDDDDRRWEWED